MKRLFALPALLLLAAGSVRAGDPQPLSRLIDKDAPSTGFFAVQAGGYVGGQDGDQHLQVLPYGYYGTKQLFDWNLFNTPVELDAGRSLQLSLHNIDGGPWSAGAGIDYDYSAIRERNPGSSYVPGANLYTFGPYAFGRLQATKALGVELSERADFFWFQDGQPPYRPKNYIQTETRLLVDVDLRQVNAETKAKDSGFYTGVYGFARQLPGDLYDNAVGASFQDQFHSDGTYGVGTLTEYLWKPWGNSGNIGLVVEGEATANTDAVYLSEVNGYRSRGYVYPHLLLNQKTWRGADISAQFGPRVDYQRFGESDNNPSYLRAGITLTQALNEHMAVSLIYQFDDDPYKASYTQQDRTGPHYIAVSTAYRF